MAARDWLRGISDDAEDAVALAAIMTRIRMDEAELFLANHKKKSWTGQHMMKLRRQAGIKHLEQAARRERRRREPKVSTVWDRRYGPHPGEREWAEVLRQLDEFAQSISKEIERRESMQPHQERVVAEKKELDEKITKLDAFRHGDVYRTLSPEERSRLTRQYVHMKDYSNVLGERIAAF